MVFAIDCFAFVDQILPLQTKSGVCQQKKATSIVLWSRFSLYLCMLTNLTNKSGFASGKQYNVQCNGCIGSIGASKSHGHTKDLINYAMPNLYAGFASGITLLEAI